MVALVEYLPGDTECRRTAEHIHSMLDAAGWDLKPLHRASEEAVFMDGITVFMDQSITHPAPVPDDVQHADDAADALLDELNRMGVRASMIGANKPHALIVIRVGLRPNPAAQRRSREEDQRLGLPDQAELRERAERVREESRISREETERLADEVNRRAKEEKKQQAQPPKHEPAKPEPPKPNQPK